MVAAAKNLVMDAVLVLFSTNSKKPTPPLHFAAQWLRRGGWVATQTQQFFPLTCRAKWIPCAFVITSCIAPRDTTVAASGLRRGETRRAVKTQGQCSGTVSPRLSGWDAAALLGMGTTQRICPT
jgi:hypothetical protein